MTIRDLLKIGIKISNLSVYEYIEDQGAIVQRFGFVDKPDIEEVKDIINNYEVVAALDSYPEIIACPQCFKLLVCKHEVKDTDRLDKILGGEIGPWQKPIKK